MNGVEASLSLCFSPLTIEKLPVNSFVMRMFAVVEFIVTSIIRIFFAGILKRCRIQYSWFLFI